MQVASRSIPEALRHRVGRSAVTVRTADGNVVADAEVVVEQVRHAFAFANIGFDFIGFANGETEATPDSPFGGAAASKAAHLSELWFELFNTATLPFYWGGFEPERGHPDTERLRRAAQWFVDHGCVVKGHPLAWHTLAPGWLHDLSTEQVEAAVRARIIREVTGFRGVIDVWDAINEVVIMPVFDKEDNGLTRLCQRLGRVETVRLAFETARSANPDATLLLNDYQVAQWPSSPEGEERQADEIVRHYTTLVGHPAVQSITYWGLTDDGAWLGAPAGLVRSDGTPKPAYRALRGLLKDDWWLGQTRVRTDDEGRIGVEGFAGEYRITAGDRSGSVVVDATDGGAEVVVM